MRQFSDEEIARCIRIFQHPINGTIGLNTILKHGLEKSKKPIKLCPLLASIVKVPVVSMASRDKETQQVKRFEGNPYHPGSRGRNCAKGPGYHQPNH